MSQQDNLDTVKRLYAAFGAGDPQSIFGLLAPDVEWAAPGSAPWCGDGRGLEYVQRFFQTFGTTASLKTFDSPAPTRAPSLFRYQFACTQRNVSQSPQLCTGMWSIGHASAPGRSRPLRP